MRILIDYRPALRERSGVGEYVDRTVRALAAAGAGDDITLFSSSWKDRLDRPSLAGFRLVDRRIPVRVLNVLWHRLGWPPVERLAGGTFDLVHSPHPLLLPARRAAQVVTVHDLDFLGHPERTRAEIRRDYPRLAAAHARRADRVIVPSRYTAGEVERRLGVPAARIAVCAHGAPGWAPREERPRAGYVLFVGTLEPRKNVGALLEAYGRLLRRLPRCPELRLAGKPTAGARAWLHALEEPPLKGRARAIGYVAPGGRRQLYAGAAVLVLPSLDEGFGLPALEAMATGVPVVAADRGALPEVVGDAGVLVDPADPEALADALARVIADEPFARACAERGLQRASRFSWEASARALRAAYEAAIAARSSVVRDDPPSPMPDPRSRI